MISASVELEVELYTCTVEEVVIVWGSVRDEILKLESVHFYKYSPYMPHARHTHYTTCLSPTEG